MAKVVGGFFPFPYKLGEKSVNRVVFLKQHEGQGEIKPSNRTLYIINVPQYFNKKSLKHLFAEFGEIEKVYIHMKPTSGEETPRNLKSKFFAPRSSELGCKVAYVVFKRPASLKKVFKVKEAKIVPEHLFECNIGKNKWTRQYNKSFIDTKELQTDIGAFMKEYDAKIGEEKQKEKEKSEEPDEDGWVTVSKYSKKPKIPRIEAVNKRIVDKRNTAQSRLTLMKFYKSQLRDAKMEEILELRRKFEKDKAQIALMRSNRKFKPF